MKKYVVYTLIVALAFLAVIGASSLAFASDPIGELVRRVRNFTQAELSTPGATVNDPVLGEVFVGASATKVAEVHDQSAREYDALYARSPEEREAAVAAIRKFAGDPDLTIEYGATVPNPNVSGQMVELYSAEGVQYWVDPQTDIIRQMVVMDPLILTRSDTAIEYSIQESEAQARDFLEGKSVCFKEVKDELELQVGEKSMEGEPSIRFFRWEVTGPMTDTYDLPPFIQVGVSSNGIVVNYTDFICSGR
ncbi:MAG: hypothetical protein ACP5HM_15880 [Anaerolineae bacterium]